MMPHTIKQPLNIGVLISGHGSNLQAIIDAIANNTLDANIVNVISNRTDAPGLLRATRAGIITTTLATTDYPNRDAFDLALADCLATTKADLFVLAGFMHILPATIANAHVGRMINIHPSLLPKYRGLHTHQQVLAAGDQQHGTTVHFVTPSLDAGPIIAQAHFAVDPNDTPTTLKARCQTLETPFITTCNWLVRRRSNKIPAR